MVFQEAGNFKKKLQHIFHQDMLRDIIKTRIESKPSSLHMGQSWVQLSKKVIIIPVCFHCWLQFHQVIFHKNSTKTSYSKAM